MGRGPGVLRPLSPIRADVARERRADCGKAIAETVVGPGTSFDLKGLGAGTHHFECVFHPWMRQTVKVQRS